MESWRSDPGAMANMNASEVLAILLLKRLAGPKGVMALFLLIPMDNSKAVNKF